MISDKVLKVLEFDKILSNLSQYAVLEVTKNQILNLKPKYTYEDICFELDKTEEAFTLLFEEGVGGIDYFDDVTDELDRSSRGATLSMGELLRIVALLRCARITSSSILNVNNENIIILKEIANCIFSDFYLENDIKEKILSDDTMADTASDKLFAIRKNIKRINAQIRERLSSYMRAGANKYMQDNIVSIRSGRYVVPVKAEFKNQVKGLIHDQSASGSTVFIEPTEILDLNNSLKSEMLAESAEIENILYDLSKSVGLIAEKLKTNLTYIQEIDFCYAKATYAQKVRAVKPNINTEGVIDIVLGRHPLINKNKVVPINVQLGKDYNYVLISGPNTGGKTVTLKLVGLFVIMSMSGLYCEFEGSSKVPVFNNIYADIGDEQSIYEDLSTFSSHIKNIIEICDNVDKNSLVLIDELGAGTDPEEGSALATACFKYLIEKGSYGIITTHYSALKEYALVTKGVQNASMDFDAETYMPLYKLNIGTPGTSNAIETALRLGLKAEIITDATSRLSGEKIAFDNVLKEAEGVRVKIEEERKEFKVLSDKLKEEYEELKRDREKFDREREKFLQSAKAESRKIVNEKLEEAEEILSKMKDIFAKECYDDSDLVTMSTLRNKMENAKYHLDEVQEIKVSYAPLDIKKAKVGDSVYSKLIDNSGVISEINVNKGTVWVQFGQIRSNCKVTDLFILDGKKKSAEKPIVNIKRNELYETPQTEINVIGLTSDEALDKVISFIDKAVVNNLEEVKIIHGVGFKILSTAIHNYLRSSKSVESFRFGKYGEGEHGVTFVKLK